MVPCGWVVVPCLVDLWYHAGRVVIPSDVHVSCICLIVNVMLKCPAWHGRQDICITR